MFESIFGLFILWQVKFFSKRDEYPQYEGEGNYGDSHEKGKIERYKQQ